MKAFFLYISLLSVLFFAGGRAFAENFSTTSPFAETIGKTQKVTSSSTNHTSVFELMVNDMEEEIHNGSEVNDNANSFALRTIASGINLQSVTVNSIVALKVAPLFYVAKPRIPSNPIYLTNRVFRL